MRSISTMPAGRRSRRRDRKEDRMRAAATTRPRAAVSVGRPGLSLSSTLNKVRRSAGTWVIIGVPILLVTLFAWQLVAPMLRTDVAVRDAVGFSRVSLEADPAGSRPALWAVDRVGQVTTVTG